MNASQLINQSSGNVEYFTPKDIADAARECMGHIELDPASCAEANQYIGATRFFTKADDGLKQVWKSNTGWLNHPFHRHETACVQPHDRCKKKSCTRRGYHLTEDIPGNAAWINKLVGSYLRAELLEACCITYAVTSELWFRPLLRFPQCYFHDRVNYILPDGTTTTQSTKGSVVTYLGLRVMRFARAFEKFGTIKIEFQ